MASLYKKPVLITDPRTGKRIKTKSKKWWGRFRDENGEEKRVPLAVDKPAAQAMLNELVRKTERRAAGLEDPFEKHRRRPLREHIADYEKCLRDRGVSKRYAHETIHQVRMVVEACKFDRIHDLSPSRVQEFLARFRAQGKSISSCNHYLRAIKMFAHWLVQDRRTNDDRLAHLSQMNVDLDRRHVRRPLSIEEFGLLLEAAHNGPTIRRIAGPDRAILYIVGAYTGYRRNEIGSVTRRSFDFDSTPPTLTVQAGYSKHRKTDVIALRGDFAEIIRAWLATNPELGPDDQLFRVTNKNTSEIIRRDLAAARARWLEEAVDAKDRAGRLSSSFLAYVDDQGHYADFHALRKTFITNLSRVGVAPKTAQILARHSDINLTMNTYTMLGVLDQVAAVEALPAVPEIKSRDGLRAAG